MKPTRKVHPVATYRIFRNSQTSPVNVYKKVRDYSDVTVRGSFDIAAVEWANHNYTGPERELDLLVARFGGSAIEEIKAVKIRRPSPLWTVVPSYQPDVEDDDEDEEDSF